MPTSRRRRRRFSSRMRTRARSAAPTRRRSAPVRASRARRIPSATLAPVPANNSFAYTLITPQLSVSYVPDVFGLNKRTVEAAAAQEQASRYQMIAVDITLSANVALAAITEASLEDQIDTTNELIGINRQILSLLQYQKSKGYIGGADIAAQQTQLAQLEATLAAADQAARPAEQPARGADRQLSRRRRRRKVHAGEPDAAVEPAAQPALGPGRAAARRAPGRGQPSRGQRRRSASRRANRLPNISLSANAGSNALAIGQVFGPGTGFWNIGAALLAPIFDGGTRLHQERAARAALPADRRAISRHCADRIPECRRYAGRARAGRRIR